MRFPHNAKIFRGQFEAAPYVGVFFLLVIFLLAHSAMVVVPGVPIQLPAAANLPGTDKPVAIVTVDENGTFYFENQMCDEARLRQRLQAVVERSPQPIALVARIHRAAKAEVFARLAILARDIGIREMIQEVQPVSETGAKSPP